MSTRITGMSRDMDRDNTIRITTEHGETIEAREVASDGRYTIANYEGDDGRRRAIEISDHGPRDLTFYEHNEGDTFDADYKGSHVVRACGNDGSLEWIESN